MDFGEIPDDIWISIFEQIEDPSTLAVLVRTCRRYYSLASKLLLRELRWLKPELTLRNIEAWAGVYSSVAALPRKITIGVPFEFAHAMRQSIPPVSSTITLSAEMKLHDLIHTQLLRFTSITEICLDGTVISPYSYCVLGEIPTLRSLLLENCTFINLHVSFGTRATNQFPSHPFDPNTHPTQDLPCPLQIISLVPIKHLSLHRVMVPSEYENYRYHPLCLLTIPTLTSLSITWHTSIAARYAQNRWALPNLTDLSVVMPLMSRDLLDELATFVHNCELPPRFKLKIEKHNLSDTQITTVQIPSTGLWNYEGPLAIVAGSSTNSSKPTLTHVKINETLELPPLLDGLEKLPMVIEELEVQVGKWDIELLFAIKQLFKRIKKLVVRYVRGGLPENLLVRLGADILFCLPDLVSIKLLGPNKTQEDTNPERSSVIRSVGSSNSSPSPGTSVGSANASSRIHAHGPVSHVSAFHNVVLGTTPTRSGHHDDLDFNADDFECTVSDMEQGEVRAHSPSTHGFSPPFQTNRPGLLNWNSASHSSAASSSSAPSTTSTYRSSSNRFASVFAKKQGCSERQNSKSSDNNLEAASPLSQAELGDYLIGWNRYCPSLRVVQIDHRWWWERRFAGDPWALRVHRRGNARNSDKGKEREETLFA